MSLSFRVWTRPLVLNIVYTRKQKKSNDKKMNMREEVFLQNGLGEITGKIANMSSKCSANVIVGGKDMASNVDL